MSENWIADAIKNKGALHKALGIEPGQKITAKKLDKALHSRNVKLRKEANLAKTLRRFSSKGR